MSAKDKIGGLNDAKSVTASLHRSRNVLYKALHGSELAVNQLSVDGELISDALNEHQYELKTSLKSTQSRLRTVQTYEFWEKYSLTASLIFFFLVVFYIIAKRIRLFSLLYALFQSYLAVGSIPSFTDLTTKISSLVPSSPRDET